MSEGAFRTAEGVASGKSIQAPTPEAQNPDVPVGANVDDVEAPISFYSEVNGHPYTAEYFEVVDIFRNPNIGMLDEILNIEEAYKRKVASGELEDGRKYFDAFIKEAEKATNSQNASKPVKIAKISAWVKFMGDLERVDRG